jgi:hypothetical protein
MWQSSLRLAVGFGTRSPARPTVAALEPAIERRPLPASCVMERTAFRAVVYNVKRSILPSAIPARARSRNHHVRQMI